jgi:hypothetical protein
MFIMGRNNSNVNSIMSATKAIIAFPDPNTVSPQRKGTVVISGSIDSVFCARQYLIVSNPGFSLLIPECQWHATIVLNLNMVCQKSLECIQDLPVFSGSAPVKEL